MLTPREEFLRDVMTTAIENYGYGWFTVQRWVWDTEEPEQIVAEITSEDEGEEFKVTLDTIKDGFTKLAEKVPTLLILDEGQAKWAMRMLNAYVDVHEGAGDIDVADALWILETALFGEPTYS